MKIMLSINLTCTIEKSNFNVSFIIKFLSNDPVRPIKFKQYWSNVHPQYKRKDEDSSNKILKVLDFVNFR